MRSVAFSRCLSSFRFAMLAASTLGTAACSSDATNFGERLLGPATGRRPSAEVTNTTTPAAQAKSASAINSTVLLPPPGAQAAQNAPVSAPMAAPTPVAAPAPVQQAAPKPVASAPVKQSEAPQKQPALGQT